MQVCAIRGAGGEGVSNEQTCPYCKINGQINCLIHQPSPLDFATEEERANIARMKLLAKQLTIELSTR